MKQVEFFQLSNQQGTSFPSFQCFAGQIQVYKSTLRSLITWGSINSNITDYIIKVINAQYKKRRKKNGTLRNTNINLTFLQRHPIQNHFKLSITEKWWNKTKYPTWNSIRLEFVKKKTSMPNTVYDLGYTKCHSSSIRSSSKNPSNSVRYNYHKMQLNERTVHTGNQKNGHISQSNQQAYYLQVF